MKLDLDDIERDVAASGQCGRDVVDGLIAEIRSLRAGQAQIARVFTGDVATARIIGAAIAFVDEQGKRVSIERGHTIGRADDFASEQFAELARAVEAAGR